MTARPLRVLRDENAAVIVTGVGRGWLHVPGVAWGAFIAAVKRGDYAVRDGNLADGPGLDRARGQQP